MPRVNCNVADEDSQRAEHELARQEEAREHEARAVEHHQHVMRVAQQREKRVPYESGVVSAAVCIKKFVVEVDQLRVSAQVVRRVASAARGR